MRRFLAPAALALALAAAPVRPAPASAAGDDWVTYRNDSETVEVQVPPGFKEMKIEKDCRLVHLQYDDGPYKQVQVKINGYKGYIDRNMPEFVKFVTGDVGGKHGKSTFLEGSKTRFVCERPPLGPDGSPCTEGNPWMDIADSQIPQGGYAYYVDITVPKPLFEEKRGDFDRMVGSFVGKPPPADRFTVPRGWEKVQNDLFGVIGPSADIKDAEQRKAINKRVAQIANLWLDPQKPAVQMIRDYTGDKRKFVARLGVQVFPARDQFQAAAGEEFREGAFALYLPSHPEKIVIVDGSPESTLDEHELVGVVSLQMLEARMAPFPPWLREAFHIYFENGSRRKAMPGLFPPEMLKKAKELFAKSPAPFEDLLGKDDAGMRALGEAGSLAAWGYLQWGLHGVEGPLRDLFVRYTRGLVGATDAKAVWDREVAAYLAATRRKVRLKDVDEGAKKFWKALKE